MLRHTTRGASVRPQRPPVLGDGKSRGPRGSRPRASSQRHLWSEDAVRLQILSMLAEAVEQHDAQTSGHAARAADSAAAIAIAYGLGADRARLIGAATPLHDIGKISVPAKIIAKQDRLTPAEYEQMKQHTTSGAKLLSGGRAPLLRLAELIALTHHEWWDGSGYHGIEGLRIPLAARIVAVADVFDALTRDRVYKPAWDEGDAVKEIIHGAGTQFDPDVVEAFLVCIEERVITGPSLEPNPA